MKIRNTTLVKGFRQSAPYVNAHRGKTMVIMLDGETIDSPNFTHIISDIALLHSLGVKIVLVHGARPQINRIVNSHKLPSPYHKGIRITNRSTLELAMQAAGQLQLGITAKLSMSLNNTPMAGTQLNVISGNFVIAQPMGVDEGVDYSHSGKVRRIDKAAISQVLEQGSIVLIGPIASSVTGECFNLLFEDIATKIAIKLKADKLIGFCSERGIADSEGNIIPELFPSKAESILHALETNNNVTTNNTLASDEHLIASGHVITNSNSGTLRFLKSSIEACRAGVKRSHLISYNVDGALIQELFSLDGIGTQVVMASTEQVRSAKIDDIGGILALIRPLEEQGILVRRSREQLEQEVHQFTLIEKDNLVIGCAALYPYPEEKMAEMACVAIHPEYRDGNRGLNLLHKMKQHSKNAGIEKMFVLTTHSLHWFREQGFYEVDISSLPMEKQSLYNFQRCSKILCLDL